jgi:hypothetical protein
MTPPAPHDPFAGLPCDDLVSSPTVVPPDEYSHEVPMTDAPSHHDDWYQSDDALAAAPEPSAPAASPRGPTLAPPTEPSLGLRGLLAAVVPAHEPSLGLGGFAVPDVTTAVTDGPTEAAPAHPVAARLLAAVSSVPIERVAPLTAVAFVCSLLVWAIVQVLS